MGERDWLPDTKAAQALGWIDEKTRALFSPLQPVTTYLRDEDNQYRSGRAYARADFWEERVRMIVWWADRCDELRRASIVMPLRAF